MVRTRSRQSNTALLLFELDCFVGGYVGTDARKTMSTITVYESLLVGAHGFICYGTCCTLRVFVVARLLSLRAQLSFVCKGLHMARGSSVAFRCACKQKSDCAFYTNRNTNLSGLAARS